MRLTNEKNFFLYCVFQILQYLFSILKWLSQVLFYSFPSYFCLCEKRPWQPEWLYSPLFLHARVSEKVAADCLQKIAAISGGGRRPHLFLNLFLASSYRCRQTRKLAEHRASEKLFKSWVKHLKVCLGVKRSPLCWAFVSRCSEMFLRRLLCFFVKNLS